MKDNFKRLLIGTTIGLIATQASLYASDTEGGDALSGPAILRTSFGNAECITAVNPTLDSRTDSRPKEFKRSLSEGNILNGLKQEGDKTKLSSKLDEIALYKEMNNKLTESINLARSHISESSLLMEDLKKELNESKKEIARLTQNLQEARQEADTTQQELQQQLEEVREEVDRKEQARSLAENEVANLQLQSHNSLNQIAELRRQHVQDERLITELEQERTEAQNQAQKLSRELDKTQNNIRELVSASETLQSQNRDLVSEQNIIQRNVRELVSANEGFQSQLQELGRQRDEAIHQISDLQEQLRRANEQASLATTAPVQTSEGGLPADFDADGYLQLNQDIRNAYANVQSRFPTIQEWAVHHYTNHGQAKGRRYK